MISTYTSSGNVFDNPATLRWGLIWTILEHLCHSTSFWIISHSRISPTQIIDCWLPSIIMTNPKLIFKSRLILSNRKWRIEPTITPRNVAVSACSISGVVYTFTRWRWVNIGPWPTLIVSKIIPSTIKCTWLWNF